MKGERIDSIPELNETSSIGLDTVVKLCRDGQVAEAQQMYTQIKSAQLTQNGESGDIYPFLVYSRDIEIDTLDQAIFICRKYENDPNPFLVRFYATFSDWITEQIASIEVTLKEYDAIDDINIEEYTIYCDCLFRQVYYMGIDLFVLRNTRCAVSYISCLKAIYNNHSDFFRNGATLFFTKHPFFFMTPDGSNYFFRGNCSAISDGRKRESSLNEEIRKHMQEVFSRFFHHRDFEILLQSDDVIDFFSQMQHDARYSKDEIFTIDIGDIRDTSRKIGDEQYFLDQLPIGAYDMYQFFRQEMEQKYGTIFCGAIISTLHLAKSDKESSEKLKTLIGKNSELALFVCIEQIVHVHQHRTFDVKSFLASHNDFPELNEGNKILALIFLIAYTPLIGIQFLQKYPTLIQHPECMNAVLAYLSVSSIERNGEMQVLQSIFPCSSGKYSHPDIASLASSMKKTLIKSAVPQEKMLGYSIGYYSSILFSTEHSNSDYFLDRLADSGVDRMRISGLELQKEGKNKNGLSKENVNALFSKSLDPRTLKPDRYVLEQCIMHSMRRSDFGEAMRYYRIGIDMGVEVGEYGILVALESHNFPMLAQMLRDMTDNFSKIDHLSEILRAYLTRRIRMILSSSQNNEDHWYLTGLIILLGLKWRSGSSQEAILFEHIGLLDVLVREKNLSLHDRIHDLYMRDTYENGLMLSMETLLHQYLLLLYTHFCRKNQFSSSEKQKCYIEQVVVILSQYSDTEWYIGEWWNLLQVPSTLH